MGNYFKYSIAVATLGIATVNTIPVANASTNTAVVVNETDSIDTAKVTNAINKMQLKPNASIAVLFTNSGMIKKDSYNKDLKSYVLSHKNDTKYSNFLNDSKDNLRSNQYLIAVSPNIHKMGVYGGDGTNINDDFVKSTLNVMGPYFKKNDWTNGTIAGAQNVVNQINGNTPHSIAESNANTSNNNDAHKFWEFLKNIIAPIAAIGAFICAIGVGASRFYRGKNQQKREKDKQAQDRRMQLEYTGEPKNKVDHALNKYKQLQEYAMSNNIKVPNEVNDYYNNLKSVADNDYLLTEDQRLNKAYIKKYKDLINKANTYYAYQIDEMNKYNKIGDWKKQWDKIYQSYIKKINTSETSLNKQKNHLSENDYNDLAKLIESARNTIMTINERVLNDSDYSLSKGEDKLNLTITVLNREVRGIIKAANVTNVPKGMKKRLSYSNNTTTNTNSALDFNTLLWVSAMNNGSYYGGSSHSSSSHHNNSSSSSSSSNSSSSYSGFDSSSYSSSSFDSGSSGGGFDGGSGSW